MSDRSYVIRGASRGLEFRDAGDDAEDGSLGTLRILFNPADEWAEIRSAWEGNFLERFAPGAWRKTIKENGAKVKALFQHGMDPQIGDKPLGEIRRLEETDRGGEADVTLHDTSFNRDLLPGLKAGLYGASHRFGVVREEIDAKPERSEHNPDGLPEHTIKEARLAEMGPVTWPAYAGATAGVRSLTDHFIMRCFEQDRDKLRAMFEQGVSLVAVDEPTALSEEKESREQHPSAPAPRVTRKASRYLQSRKDEPTWLIPSP